MDDEVNPMSTPHLIRIFFYVTLLIGCYGSSLSQATAEVTNKLKDTVSKTWIKTGIFAISEWTKAVHQHSSRQSDLSHRHLFVLPLDLDLSHFGPSWLGTLHIQGLGFKEDPSLVQGKTLTGDQHVYSNLLVGEDRLMLFEAFWESSFKHLTLRLGKLDANDHFAASNALTFFVNGTAGFSPPIYGLTSYPDSAWSAQFWWNHPLFDWGVAAFDGGSTELNSIPTGKLFLPSRAVQRGGLFWISEITIHLDQLFPLKPQSSLSLGVWSHQGQSRTQPQPPLTPNSSPNLSSSPLPQSSSGFFSVWDLPLGHGGGGNFTLGGQMAFAPPSSHLPNHHFALGLVWENQNQWLKDSQWGIYGSYLHFTSSKQSEYLIEYSSLIPIWKDFAVHGSYIQIIDQSRDLFAHLLMIRLQLETYFAF